MNNRSLHIVLCLFVFQHGLVSAQALQNIRASFDGEKIIVNYDLIDPDPRQEFKVTLYSSHDSYTAPLAALTGDTGASVLPGKNKNVNWHVKSGLPADFDNTITIKVKALRIVKEVPVPDPAQPSTTATKLTLLPVARSKFKRGDSVDLRWAGGNEVKTVSIVLLKDNVIHSRIAENVENKQTYSWTIPRKSRTGKNYAIEVVNTNNSVEQTTTPVFTIRPRTAMLIKTLPIAGAVGVATVLLLGGNKSSSEELPGPVNPN
jgi:hypothetical protein